MTLRTDIPDCRTVEWENTTPVTLRELLDGDPVIWGESQTHVIAFELKDRVIWIQDKNAQVIEVCNLLWARENAKALYDGWWFWRKSKQGKKLLKTHG